jgi:hypothetical protein
VNKYARKHQREEGYKIITIQSGLLYLNIESLSGLPYMLSLNIDEGWKCEIVRRWNPDGFCGCEIMKKARGLALL